MGPCVIACMFFGLELAQNQLPIRFHGYQLIGTAGGEMKVWLEGPSPPRKVRTLSREEEKRIRVQWGKNELWKGSDARLLINGKLLIESEDGKSLRPLDFAPGVGVILGRTSKDRPNWSKKYDDRESVWSYELTRADGSFEANIALCELVRTVGKTDTFQIGITLGKTDWFHSVRFTNECPVLPQTIGTISIPGPRPIDQTMQFINGVPRIRFYGYDPVRLIRAVNHLHDLGKAKSIQAMRDYLKLIGVRHNRRADPDPANLDDGNQQAIYLILALLFRPSTPSDAEVAHEFRFALLAKPTSDQTKNWPEFPFALENDIPFLIAREISGWEGIPPYPDTAIDWAENHGKFRDKPLLPSDNPLLAVENLIALRKPFPHFSGVKPETELRRQAWRAVRHLVPNDTSSIEERSSYLSFDVDKNWQKYKSLIADRKIRWDEKWQEYVADRAAKDE